MGRQASTLRISLHPDIRFLAKCRRGLLRQPHKEAPQARRVPVRAGTQRCHPPRPRRSDAAKAETYFEHALAIARAQQAKSWELRAAMSMARLWRDQGKRDEALDLLAPVYGWFTEGFDTRDLNEAKALLDELQT